MSRPRTVLFIGVDTAGSRVHALFPHWMAVLGADAILEGVDLPLDTPHSEYRALLESILADESALGAVVTSHKIALYASCADLFAEMDDYVELAREVNCIWRHGDTLAAGARDPAAVVAVLGEMSASKHWRDHRTDVLCFGAGGAATAIALALLAEQPSLRNVSFLPRKIVFTDVRPDRIEALSATLGTLAPFTAEIDFVLTVDQREADRVLHPLPPGSLVVNATGIGKDVPGSPVSDSAVFPSESVVWDLNYRGDLGFLRQARAQQRVRRLEIHDGWRYFLHGWFQALAPILHFTADRRAFEQLEAVSR